MSRLNSLPSCSLHPLSVTTLHRLLKLSKRKDYYKILGIERGATDLEIKKAYKQKALRHHPDRHVDAEPEEREEEEKIFKEVSEAYCVLSDQRKKMRYDSGQDMEEMGGMGEYWGGRGGMGWWSVGEGRMDVEK